VERYFVFIDKYQFLTPKIFNKECGGYYMFSYFTTNAANQALPDVIKKFEIALAKKNIVAKLEQELQMNIVATNSFEDYITIKQKFNSAMTEFFGALEMLEKTGVSVKSIEEGLLDFPSKRFDEEVWLCWKYGETEIKFWHEKDSGFMGRKPIEVSDESLI
jgi:hypothetical protein